MTGFNTDSGIVQKVNMCHVDLQKELLGTETKDYSSGIIRPLPEGGF